MELFVDPSRLDRDDTTGIYVRAKHGDRWGSHDIATLDAASLLRWLQSGAEAGPFLFNVIGQLLGHGVLVDS